MITTAVILVSFADAAASAPISDGTLIGGIAVLLSLVISGAGLFRSWRLDTRTAKKQDIDTVIENYRVLLTEGKDREKKLEQMVDRLEKLNAANEKIINELRIVISRLEGENATLKTELDRYRKTDAG